MKSSVTSYGNLIRKNEILKINLENQLTTGFLLTVVCLREGKSLARETKQMIFSPCSRECPRSFSG